jgi:hypothetical protein
MDQMSPQDQAIYDQIIVPTFIQKCAERGRTFTQENLATHLENATMVQMHKEAAAQDMSKQANALLKQSLGMVAQEAAQASDASIKSAAAKILANPELKKLLS